MEVIDDLTGLVPVVVGAGVVQKITQGFFPDPQPAVRKAIRRSKSTNRRTKAKARKGSRKNVGRGNFSNVGM